VDVLAVNWSWEWRTQVYVTTLVGIVAPIALLLILLVRDRLHSRAGRPNPASWHGQKRRFRCRGVRRRIADLVCASNEVRHSVRERGGTTGWEPAVYPPWTRLAIHGPYEPQLHAVVREQHCLMMCAPRPVSRCTGIPTPGVSTPAARSPATEAGNQGCDAWRAPGCAGYDGRARSVPVLVHPFARALASHRGDQFVRPSHWSPQGQRTAAPAGMKARSMD
jgi:hypothetical protein